ncbi:uncharacterized protein [Chelonus insularis]|uniref:uncharacterized protein n=1 Tax=Chelonus insularis TaxID=460826 RepID=UPI00158A8358|nr:uncharacterized protein LOC118072276 [Chelonus insularis]
MRPAPTINQESQDIHPYFLPHHGVLRPSSTTTKLKVVFNGSSPTSTGISLNDITHTGAKIQLDIFDVLLWSPHESTYSKRLILSEVAQIYDPLGFVSPITIRAKMLLQELWLHKLSWDQPVSQSIINRWLIIREEFTQLHEISLPRWIHSTRHSTVEIHGFSDALQLAMAAAIYLKINSPSTGPKITLICAKTKVAPIKQITIPRLELTAALILAKLTKYVRATLHRVNIHSIYLWTDSSITHPWINSNAGRWKDFVRNRAVKIQELVADAHWHHISGKENPADCASRGITANQLKDYSLWWRGPTWLAENQENWPVNSPPADEACNLEARPGILLIAAIQDKIIQWDWVTDILHSTITSPLASITIADIEKARNFWIKSTQAAHFHQKIRTLSNNQHLPPNHSFNRLTAYVDSEGILRVGGRLQHAQLSHDSKHQSILPRHLPFTTLVIRHYHLTTLHGGTQLTLTTIRQRSWIMGGRAPVKTFILRCIKCARQRGIRAQQLMGQLPRSRITPSWPFSHTGIDYAGPFTIKTSSGRGAKTRKAWVCVFVCMSTSAVHLGAVSDYSTEAFIAAYRRFTSRRGLCQTIYSHCGRNFIGTDIELKKLFTQFTREHEVISRFIITNGTQWSFNPPAAPHMGGKWESVVKSLKFHLTRTVKESLFTFEEITTLLTQIEAILNSRPLEPISDDPEDIQALTPGHFLIGSALNTVPEPSTSEPAHSIQNRWRMIQRQSQQFWYRWSQSYLQKLQAISKWFFRNRTIQVGALALLTDERFPPSHEMATREDHSIAPRARRAATSSNGEDTNNDVGQTNRQASHSTNQPNS